MFSKWGPVDEVQIVYDHQTGRSRGFAFVYMHNTDDATDVREKISIICPHHKIILLLVSVYTWAMLSQTYVPGTPLHPTVPHFKEEASYYMYL